MVSFFNTKTKLRRRIDAFLIPIELPVEKRRRLIFDHFQQLMLMLDDIPLQNYTPRQAMDEKINVYPQSILVALVVLWEWVSFVDNVKGGDRKTPSGRKFNKDNELMQTVSVDSVMVDEKYSVLSVEVFFEELKKLNKEITKALGILAAQEEGYFLTYVHRLATMPLTDVCEVIKAIYRISLR